MEMSLLYKELKKLKLNERKVVYTSKSGVQVAITQTQKFSKYDFKVGLLMPGKSEFNPTHIRLLIDLYIKNESNANDARKLFLAMEEMYLGKDPLKLVDMIRNLHFPMKLDEPEVNLFYPQLLMIEQDYNFGPDGNKKSNFNPPREYLMRFIRWVGAGDTEIDKIIFAAAGRKYPAPNRYASPIK